MSDLNPNSFKKNTKKNNDSGNGRPPGLPPVKQNSPIQTALIWMLIIITVIVALNFLETGASRKGVVLEYSQFKALIADSGNVKVAEVVQKSGLKATLSGEVYNIKSLEAVAGEEKKVTNKIFTVNIPFLDSGILSQWD